MDLVKSFNSCKIELLLFFFYRHLLVMGLSLLTSWLSCAYMKGLRLGAKQQTPPDGENGAGINDNRNDSGSRKKKKKAL